MQQKTYRIGFVGLSGITASPRSGKPLPPFQREIIFSHAASLDLLPNADIVGVCDLVPDLLEKFKQDWGARWPSVHTYTDYKEMLAKEDLDVLTVATSDHRHAPMVIDGGNAGVRGIFCEKPLATSMEEVNHMIETCESNDVVLMVDHSRRWVPLLHKVRDVIRSGAIGTLTNIVATRHGPRAMLFRNGTHVIDEICFFAESEPAQVFARLEDGFEDWDQYKGDGGKLPENDPGASGFVLFRNGVRALYSGMKNTADRHTLQLSGTKGQIFQQRTTYPYSTSATMATEDPDTGEEVLRTLHPDQYEAHGLVAAYRELFEAIETGSPVISPAREARKTVQIMLGFLKSQHEGCRLVDVPE